MYPSRTAKTPNGSRFDYAVGVTLACLERVGPLLEVECGVGAVTVGLAWPLPLLAIKIICAHLRPATAGSLGRYCLSELGFEVLLRGRWMV